MGILMLDVIICLYHYLFLSCFTCIRLLYDENEQFQLQEDNLVKTPPLAPYCVLLHDPNILDDGKFNPLHKLRNIEILRCLGISYL